MLLLCALIVGSGTMWAETEVLSWSRSGSTNTYTNGYTFSATASAKSGFYQDASGTAGIKLYSENNAICDKTPTSVTFTASVGGGSANKDLSNSVYVCYVDKSGNVIGGTETVVTNKITTAGGDTYNISMSTAKATNAYGVYIYHTKESGYNVRYFSFSLSYVASSGTTYSITAESNNESFGTVSLSGNVITGSPNTGYRYADPAYTVAPENSATVVQDGNTFTVTPTANTTITINFEAIPTHTATFSVNGTTTTTDFQEGAAITFPANPTDIDGKSFVGWTETAISGTTDEKPTFVTSATMGEADVTYYAVFAEIEGEPGWTETALSDIEDTDIFVFSNGSYAMSNDNGASAAPAAVAITVKDGKITSVVADNLKWNVSGNATNGYTFYPNGSTTTWLYCNTTASSSNNNCIRVGTGDRKIWKFDNNNYLATKDDNTARYLSIYSNQDFRGYINTSNGAFVPKFYKYSEGTCSGYCTTVAADTREEAGLSFTESTATVEWYSANQYTGQALTNPNGLPVTWTSSNEEVATVENGTVKVLALGETTIKASFDGDNNYKKGEASYVLTVQDSRLEPTVTIHDTFITHTNVFEGTAAGPLTASVKYNDEDIEGATVTWSGNNDAVATINATSGSVDLVAPGTVTFTATYAGNADYSAKTATYEMTVTYSDPNAPGTENNPYTVAEARAAIDAGTGLTNVYATGIVSQTGTLSNGAISYYISDDGTTTDQLQAYKGKGIGGANFTSADDIQLGDIVVIKGNLKKYNSIYEFDSGNELVSLVRKPAAPTFSPAAGTYTSTQYVTISAAEGAAIYYTTDGTSPTTESNLYSEPIEVNTDMTIKAIAVKDSEVSDVATAEYVIDLTPSIVFDDKQSLNVLCTAGEADIHFVASNITGTVAVVLCDANGGAATYDWFSAALSDDNVHIQWQANEDPENSRTAFFKLTNGTTTSELFALTQAKYVPDYATLPFEFNGGKSDFASKTGLTQNGLGSDYNANNNPTTKLKFDSTGDWMILKINEIPGTLTFDIKGNSFSDGTFKVQTSADGTTYTDLATYTDLGDTQTETFNNLAADVRYIKWIYTNKSTGNVGLGNISLGNTMAVAIAAACTDGTKCYSTFSSSKPFIVSEDLTVSEIGIEDGTMNVVNYATGETVPANTGVMVSATDGGNYVVNISKEAGTSKLGTNNALRPSGPNGITAEAMNNEPVECKFYRLTMHGKTDTNPGKIGFWWGAENGAAFAVAANKAYLAVPASVAGARSGFAFGDDATGISQIENGKLKIENYYDLQGRKVSKPGKGLYIVNGKKVVIK